MSGTDGGICISNEKHKCSLTLYPLPPKNTQATAGHESGNVNSNCDPTGGSRWAAAIIRYTLRKKKEKKKKRKKKTPTLQLNKKTTTKKNPKKP